MVGLAREVAALLGGELHPPEPDGSGDRRRARTVDIAIEDFDGVPALHRPRLPRRRDRPVAAVAAGAALPRRHAPDLERRRRDELRHARAGQPAARVRPRRSSPAAGSSSGAHARARSCARSTGRSADLDAGRPADHRRRARGRARRRSWAARRARSPSTTTEVLLEAANFEPLGILRSSERLALRTEGSNRWEKGVDPYLAEHCRGPREPAARRPRRRANDGSRRRARTGCRSARSFASVPSARRA